MKKKAKKATTKKEDKKKIKMVSPMSHNKLVPPHRIRVGVKTVPGGKLKRK